MKAWKRITSYGLFVLVCLGCAARKDRKNEAHFGIADLVGIWSVKCAASQFGQLAAYRIAGLQITASGNFIYENSHYGDDKCTVKYYDESSNGSLTIGDSVDATGKRIIVTGSRGTGTAKDAVIVNVFNTLGVCGYKSWVKDQPKDLMGTECIGWSESNSTDGINLIDTTDGKKQIQVFSLATGGDKARMAGDDFTKD